MSGLIISRGRDILNKNVDLRYNLARQIERRRLSLDVVELIRCDRNSFSVPELRKMLGIGKTESYWILKHRKIETVTIHGQIRILRSSFQEWYRQQTKYQIIGGPPPGEALRETSYSVKELAKLLAVSDDTIYTRISRGEFDTFTVDNCTRITKASFERWYSTQEKHRRPEDRAHDERIRQETYSMPEIARMLGVHRNTIYGIVGNEKNRNVFEIVRVSGQQRVTIESFKKWLNSQKRYKLKPQTERDYEEFTAETQMFAEPEIDERQEPQVLSKQNYRIEDIQEQLKMSRKSIYKLIQAGEIKATKVGKTYLIPVSEYNRIAERRNGYGSNCAEK